ncbi:KEOPS complex subunit Cgi121 [Methanobrevibacter sp. DSM 116169]|uniref:KEOPS complex subunit Cgi121 n=1 Tax=Methanobrevibacter sp. DSM 116169 TaxID=3242727 RepID=UPI0038FC30D5
MNLDNLEIYGFKGSIEDVNQTLDFLKTIQSSHPDCIIQFLDANHIAGQKHIRHGVFQAINAFNREENIANDLSVEIVLRSSAQRQISKAFEILGVKKGKMDLCIVMMNCSNEIYDQLSTMYERDDNVLLKDSSKLLKVYDISSEELSIMDIEDILIDKITKLNVDY